MMKQLTFILIGGLSVAFTACNDANIDELSTSEVDLSTEEAVESALEDIDVISDAALDESTATGGRIDRDEVLECATVTRDTVNHVVTVDYGDGCEGRRGRIRKGKVIITHDGERRTEGSSRSVTFEDFFVDSTQIEGTRTHTITDIDEEAGITIVDIVLEGGKMIFADGSSVTRDASKTRTSFRGDNREDSYASVTAAATGLTREGVTYSMETIEPIVFKRACWSGKVFVPVSGIKMRTVGEDITTVDYGDGTCDNIATVTKADGTIEEIELQIRGRRRGK